MASGVFSFEEKASINKDKMKRIYQKCDVIKPEEEFSNTLFKIFVILNAF